ncbi:MAG TPA: type II and III secretion system protein [Cytophagaceae bacterium]|jgi:type IV pilus assembly protein PilQ
MRNFIFIVLLFSTNCLFAQQQDRFEVLEQRLRDLASLSPGLNETADYSVSGGSIQELLKALAETHNLNVSVDPGLNFKVYNNFTGEKVYNILIFLAREYDLDIRFVGSIMSFFKFNAPVETPKIFIKEINVKYNSYNDLLSLDLRNDTLRQVLRKIVQLSKKNVIVTPEMQDKPINIYVEDMPFEGALEKMAFANNLSIIKNPDSSFLIKSIAEGDVAGLSNPLIIDKKQNRIKRQNQMKAQSIGANTANFTLESNKDSLGNHLISVDATNTPLVDIIKAASEETDFNYLLYSEIKGTTTTKINNVSFNELLGYIFQGTDYTYKTDQGIYLIGERKLEGLRATRVYQFKYRSLDAINELIPAEIKKGVEIKDFKELNSILLTGSLPQIDEIIAFIKPLDKLVPMITIEVILLDIRKGKSISTGIKAGISDSVQNKASILPGLDFTFNAKTINDFLGALPGSVGNLGRVTPNFYVSLSALENNNNVEVRSMPKLSTLNGHEANLSIGSTRYYAQSTQNVLGSLNTQTVVTQQFNSVEANLAINIKPVVSGDDHVTLSIDVNISDFLGDPPAQGPPPTSKSQFKSIVRVRNQEMIVLGGLERYEKSEKGTGIPFLSRIPVIKWLFSSRTRSKNKVISVVFLKPTILY